MVNVRCEVSDLAAAKVAYLSRAHKRTRSQVYQDVLQWVLHNMEVPVLERNLYQKETVQGAAKATSITYRRGKPR